MVHTQGGNIKPEELRLTDKTSDLGLDRQLGCHPYLMRVTSVCGLWTGQSVQGQLM